MSKSDSFESLFDIKAGKKYRFSNEELLLRALAHSEDYENYTGPLSKYLNDFMSDNRNADVTQFKDNLKFAIKFIYKRVMTGTSFGRVSKAQIEALFVAVIRNRAALKEDTDAAIMIKYNGLKNDPLFSVDALKEGLAAPDKVIARLNRAIEIFS